MKVKKVLIYAVTVIMLLSMTFTAAMAEDGLLFRRNISKTPDNETEKAAIYMMDFYVPAQASTGELVSIDNYDLETPVEGEDGSLITKAYDAREYAKPLITVWIDDLHPEEDAKGGITFGHFDAFVGVSLDDGTSWKTSNLSKSSDLSSFNLATGEAYPGDVHNVVHQVSGDNIFVAWVSKYCEGGTPLYTLDPLEDAEYFTDLEDNYAKDGMYLYDLFGVKGNQGSVDYTLQGFPEIGEIPYSCVWTARGKLLAGDDLSTDGVTEATHVVWTKPERLTSGTRDANLPAVDCAPAGCIMTWQEDPEGLRPGQGLGPGEGWSGAVANAKTDIWYSYISFADFDKVVDTIDGVEAVVPIADFAGTTMPKAYVPMAMPVRLTDNNMCKGVSSTLNPSDPYCYIDFDTFDEDHTTITAYIESLVGPDGGPETGADFCYSEIPWETPGGSTIPICVTENGRVMNGRVASTRVRLNLKPYTQADGTPSGWVVMGSEETKALGDILIDPYGNPTEDPIDIGKDMWYYSFDMFDHIFVDQGGMINQPAKCSPWTVGVSYECDNEFFPVQTDPLNDGDYYLTEISRRFALTTNSVSAAVNSESGLAAMLIYKQGIINQGGPADVMLRRVVIPPDFDAAVDNPYAFENMECAEWAYTNEDNGGANPNYLKGLCLSPAINITATTITECSGGLTGNDNCAAEFPVADDGSIPDNEGDFPKVLGWRQCDGTDAIDGCELDYDLDDQSWENPYDVAKGHRGFLDGDYVMMMYAWSPNWKANSVGNDHYNLYVRRSFDGGLTWTTTPAELGGEGITTTENYCVATSSEECVGTEFDYAAGAFEQGRNVSQLIGNKVTILDPRYTPSGGLKEYATIKTTWLDANSDKITVEVVSDDVLPYEDDAVRDSSVYFMIYETGDNTTVAEGEAVPLDLFYSRATVYGDYYELDPDWYEEGEDGILVIEDYRWPWVENKHDLLSGEASMLANPGGTFMYAVWNQWQEDEHENVFDSDIWYRRFLYNDTLEAVPTTSLVYTGPTMQDTDNEIILIATARDLDSMGEGDEIVEYEWTVDGVVDPDTKGNRYNAPPRTLSNGWHGFSVRAKDNEGHWSNSASFDIYVAEDVYTVHIPITVTP